MLRRAVYLGSTLFLVLVGIALLGMGAAYWHHQSVANVDLSSTKPTDAEIPPTHIDVVFMFAVSPLTLALGALTAWGLCVSLAYLWLSLRR